MLHVFTNFIFVDWQLNLFCVQAEGFEIGDIPQEINKHLPAY
jgi:hypothetical protein